MKAIPHQRLVLSLLVCLFSWASFASAQFAPTVVGRRPAEESIRLQPILAPASGSAAFYIIEEVAQSVTSATGIFSSAAFGGDMHAVHAVRAHYTVLSAEEGGVRLLVRAQPVHPETGWPIAPARWEATFFIAPDGPDFESGDEIPDSLRDLVAPYWLADWSAVELEDLPTEPLLPGAEWSGPANLDWDDFPIHGLAQDVKATFAGWVDTGDFGNAAHISEWLETEGSDVQELSGGVYGSRSAAIRATSDHWLLKGDFPYGTEKWFYMYSILSVGPSTGAPEGLAGEIHMTMEMAQSVFRDPDEEIWLPYEEPESVEAGDTVLGMLGAWSETSGSGAYMKAYAFRGEAGDAVDIYLASPDFDALLILADESFGVLASDDDSAGGTDSLIRAGLPYTGVYYVVVTTYYEGAEGVYALHVE